MHKPHPSNIIKGYIMKQGKIYLYDQYVGLLTTIKEKQYTIKK